MHEETSAPVVMQASEPVPPLEKIVLSVWTQVLSADTPIGRDDNFFALGGDSVGALTVVYRLGQVLGIEVPPPALFDAPTPRTLGEWLETQPGAAEAASRGSHDLTD
jgi:acyl carrier protein